MAAVGNHQACLENALQEYICADITKNDVLNVFSIFTDLRPKLELYVFNNGSSKDLLCLEGTIPVNYKGNLYNIPVCLWISDAYPFYPPIPFVRPTSTMGIRTGKHIDSNGRIHLPCLLDWEHTKCDIIGVIQVMRVVFEEESPVYALSVTPSLSVFEEEPPVYARNHVPQGKVDRGNDGSEDVGGAVASTKRAIQETTSDGGICSTCDRSFFGTECIICLQNREYEDGLKTDRQRAQQRTAADSVPEAVQLPSPDRTPYRLPRRIQQLPDEPTQGFELKIRFPSGTIVKRRFKKEQEFSVLCDIIGSQEEATDAFLILPSLRKLAFSSSLPGRITLEQMGLTHSSVLDVQWDDDEAHSGDTKIVTSIDDLNDVSGNQSVQPSVVKGLHEMSLEKYEDIMDDLNRNDMLEFEDSEDDADENVPGCTRALTPEVFKQILERHRQRVMVDDSYTLKISRNNDVFWQYSLRLFKRDKCDIRKRFSVQFFNESGNGEGGPRREYFDLLFKAIKNSNLLLGKPGYMTMAPDINQLRSGAFKALGKMVASIILQGGAAPAIFDQSVLDYGLHGLSAVDVDDMTSVADEPTRSMIQTIKHAPPAELVTDEVLEFLAKNHVRRQLNSSTRAAVVQDLILSNSKIYVSKAMLDNFWNGMEEGKLLTLLSEEPELMKALLCSCDQWELDAETVSNLFHIKQYGSPGSNKRMKSEVSAQHFESFLLDLEDGQCPVTFGDVLQFVTGTSCIIPGGFDKELEIHFTDERKYPEASTCALILTLPIHVADYEEFKQMITNAILCSVGFDKM